MLWRIPDLAEDFLYVNDDFAIVQPVQPTDFFRDGRVVLRGRWKPKSAHQPLRRALEAVRRWRGAEPSRAPRMREVWALLFNKRFMTLTGLAAVPAKVILTGVCFYLVPLYIVSIGNTSAMAGRMLMVYAVMMVMIVPLSASLSDNSMRRDRYVSIGLIISGLSGLLLLLSDSFLVLFGVVFLLGLGQALSIAAQSALVAEHCQEEIRIYGHDAVYGVYRLLERLGNALGPLMASVLVVLWGYQGAFIAISALVLVCGIAFTIATRGLDWQQTAVASP
jgi:MFS family permease